MDLNQIRNMNDDELRRFVTNLSQRNNIICSKCGNIIISKDRKTINIGTYDKQIGQKVKKLCSLCNDCYIDLLDYLSISDVNWGE